MMTTGTTNRESNVRGKRMTGMGDRDDERRERERKTNGNRNKERNVMKV